MQRLISGLVLSAMLATSACVVPSAQACTRAVYFGKEGQVVTGRTMDWFSEMHTNIYVYPRELARTSGTKTPFTWTSKYGSVVTTIFEGGAADGMNEKGLVANMNYLAESVYPPATTEDTRPTLSIAGWSQYLLDSFATVQEAVDAMRAESFRMVPVEAPTGETGTVHVSVSDASGDSAIFQYLDGKLTIHHGRQYQVMTNSPVYDQQLALDRYWKDIGGTVMLPGTNRASDRYVRASFYINAARQSSDAREAVATVLSVMRNVSVPRGITTEGQPNISSTIWRTVSDHKNLVYYFESTFSPSVVWLDMKKIDFAPTAGVRMLRLDGNPDLSGNQTANITQGKVFDFLVPKDDAAVQSAPANHTPAASPPR
jgi:choloylglycine hydrolase